MLWCTYSVSAIISSKESVCVCVLVGAHACVYTYMTSGWLCVSRKHALLPSWPNIICHYCCWNTRASVPVYEDTHVCVRTHTHTYRDKSAVAGLLIWLESMDDVVSCGLVCNWVTLHTLWWFLTMTELKRYVGTSQRALHVVIVICSPGSLFCVYIVKYDHVSSWTPLQSYITVMIVVYLTKVITVVLMMMKPDKPHIH